MRYQKIHSQIWNDEKFRDKKSRRLFPQKYPEDQALRRNVFLRDDFTCKRCGIKPEIVPVNYDGRYTVFLPDGTYLVVDHIIPWKKGGTIDIENLQTLCGRCNTAKGNR